MLAPRQAAPGIWTYDDSWTPELRLEWEAVQGNRLHEEQERVRIESAAAEKMAAPAMLLARARLEVDAAKREREIVERRAQADYAWVAAQAQYGEGVRRLDTVEGDGIFLLRMSELEVDAANDRGDTLATAPLALLGADASPEDRRRAQAKGLREAIGAQHDAIVDKATIPGLAPDAARARIKELCARYAGLWPKLRMLRDSMIIGFRVDEGKGSAP